MSTTSMPFGDLTLAFTTDMRLQWSSRKSGGDYKASFYQPQPPDGFVALGHVACEGYEDDGNIAALCVKGRIGDKNDDAPLAYPTKYERVWQDKGTDGKYSGACWRPVPPDGYVALGHLFGSGHETEPQTTDVVCVRKTLAYKAAYDSHAVYGTAGTDANKRFHAYQILVPTGAVPAEGRMLIAALTFFGKQGEGQPDDDQALWVLNVEIASAAAESPAAPTLTGYNEVDDTVQEIVDRTVYVPFTGITDTRPRDNGKPVTVKWQVAHSPFYAINRVATYEQVLHYYNQLATTQTAPTRTHTVGITHSQSQSFSGEVGIEVGYEEGVNLGTESKVSAKLSVSLGFSKSREVEEFVEDSVTYSMDVPGATAAALYVPHYTLQLVRSAGEGEQVAEEGLHFKANAQYVSAQYPAAGAGAVATAGA